MRRPALLSRQTGAGLTALAVIASAVLLLNGIASAAAVPTVLLGTAGNYAVLAGSEVTNTNSSVIAGNVGVFPGTAVTGFPPGIVTPPATIERATPAAAQAQADLTTAYIDAKNRPVNFTTAADLTNAVLKPGVHSGPAKSALLLNGPVTLDGEGVLSSVFIIQTDSTLTTASGSTVNLINGAQECNVFWQVGSSATLGSSSVFRGTILALTAITVNNSVVVHGRALAQNAAVTLDNDTFVKPTCAQAPPPPTSSSSTSSSSTSSSSTSSSSTSSSSTSSSTTSSSTTSSTSSTSSTTTSAPTTTTTPIPTTTPTPTTLPLAGASTLADPVAPGSGGSGTSGNPARLSTGAPLRAIGLGAPGSGIGTVAGSSSASTTPVNGGAVRGAPRTGGAALREAGTAAGSATPAAAATPSTALLVSLFVFVVLGCLASLSTLGRRVRSRRPTPLV